MSRVAIYLWTLSSSVNNKIQLVSIVSVIEDFSLNKDSSKFTKAIIQDLKPSNETFMSFLSSSLSSGPLCSPRLGRVLIGFRIKIYYICISRMSNHTYLVLYEIIIMQLFTYISYQNILTAESSVDIYEHCLL